jgi:hypothetical protein
VTRGGTGALSLLSTGEGNQSLSFGAFFNGSAWEADSTRAMLWEVGGAGITMYFNEGLSDGGAVPWSPIYHFRFSGGFTRFLVGSGSSSGNNAHNGIGMNDGTAPTTNPSAMVVQSSVTGDWRYRTSAASEGADLNHRVHNRTEQVNGAGTNYTFTGTHALVDFGTTDPSISLPTAGTYNVRAILTVLADAAGAGDAIEAKLRNTTDGADVSQVMLSSCPLNSGHHQVVVEAVVTITAAKTIQLWARNATSARGVAVSTATNIRYARMH